MAGVRSKPRTKGGRYQGFFVDQNGRKRYFLGSTSKRETLQIARKLEDDARQGLGYREPRQTHCKHRDRPFVEAVVEYLEWGKTQGGRKGRPWSASHAGRKERDLTMWAEAVGLKVLGDLDGILPRV